MTGKKLKKSKKEDLGILKASVEDEKVILKERLTAKLEEIEEEKKAAEQAAETVKPLIAKLKEALKDKATDVRVTTRLVDSPACLVSEENGMSLQLAKMLKQAGQEAPDVKPILEINADHALVKKLDGSVHFHDLAHILFDQALIADGGLPSDPAAYVKRVNALLS